MQSCLAAILQTGARTAYSDAVFIPVDPTAQEFTAAEAQWVEAGLIKCPALSLIFPNPFLYNVKLISIFNHHQADLSINTNIPDTVTEDHCFVHVQPDRKLAEAKRWWCLCVVFKNSRFTVANIVESLFTAALDSVPEHCKFMKTGFFNWYPIRLRLDILKEHHTLQCLWFSH